MAPSRAKHGGTSVAGPSKKQSHEKHPYSNDSRRFDEDALPGVQRLKSSLRQAKRLLAKDNLAADVRVETERRLKALEADLVRAEQARKERQYATKYHKVKFFERQKVIRKINQMKQRIKNSDGKEREELQSVLTDLRVDLNYVLHFPKTKKYVSLFPPEVRRSGSTAEPATASSDDNEDRSKVRDMVRQQMRRGDLSAEPDNELGKPGKVSKPLRSGRRTDAAPSIKAQTPANDVASDDFFGDDDEEDSQQSDVSDS